MNCKHIFIEGNIGAGKTTLINEFVKKKKYFTGYQENIKRWMELGLLQKSYIDPKNGLLIFQLYILFDKLCRIQHDGKNKIIERSGLADRLVFLELAIQNKLISSNDVDIYDDLYKKMLNKFDLYKNAIFIYLDVNPEICYQRLLKRNRNIESKIVDIDYLKNIDKFYRNNLIPFLKKKNIIIHNIKYNNINSIDGVIKICEILKI